MTAANITNLPTAQQQGAGASEIMEAVLLAGDLSKLTAQERTEYYLKTCASLGLNPLTRPFDYIRLSGREVLYAKRDCADQLRKINRLSLEIVDRKMNGDLLVVTVRARTPDGRTDEDMGVVSVKGLAGEALANAMLKATTKAKRRVTLSICGLGMLDETEVRSALEVERDGGGHGGGAPRIAAPVAAPPPPAAQASPKPPLTVAVPGGWDPVTFPRGMRGLREAMAFMADAIIEGGPQIVSMNDALLTTIADKIPDLREQVAHLRAAADEALLADDETDINEAEAQFSDDTFPGDLPSGA
jgi:hypothetical protein